MYFFKKLAKGLLSEITPSNMELMDVPFHLDIMHTLLCRSGQCPKTVNFELSAMNKRVELKNWKNTRKEENNLQLWEKSD